MGRLVRRYIQAYNLTVKNKIALGTWASKITQHEAGQSMVEGMINAIALGGTISAGHFGITATVSLTGNLYVTRSRVDVNDGITVTGSVYGVYTEVSVLGAGIVTGQIEGMRIEGYVEAGATIATVFGLHIANDISSDPTDEYSFIRMSENNASTVNQVFHIYKGALCTDIQYLMKLSGQGTYFDGVDTSHSTARGWMKIQVLGEDRYIQLYT